MQSKMNQLKTENDKISKELQEKVQRLDQIRKENSSNNLQISNQNEIENKIITNNPPFDNKQIAPTDGSAKILSVESTQEIRELQNSPISRLKKVPNGAEELKNLTKLDQNFLQTTPKGDIKQKSSEAKSLDREIENKSLLNTKVSNSDRKFIQVTKDQLERLVLSEIQNKLNPKIR